IRCEFQAAPEGETRPRRPASPGLRANAPAQFVDFRAGPRSPALAEALPGLSPSSFQIATCVCFLASLFDFTIKGAGYPASPSILPTDRWLTGRQRRRPLPEYQR